MEPVVKETMVMAARGVDSILPSEFMKRLPERKNVLSLDGFRVQTQLFTHLNNPGE